MKNILSPYAGKYVALVDDQVVASGRSQLEIYKLAMKLYPSKSIILEYIPTKEETLTFL